MDQLDNEKNMNNSNEKGSQKVSYKNMQVYTPQEMIGNNMIKNNKIRKKMYILYQN